MFLSQHSLFNNLHWKIPKSAELCEDYKKKPGIDLTRLFSRLHGIIWTLLT